VAEVESGRKLKVLRTDRGGEFTSMEFRAYCTEEGVQRQLTAPYSPQQNRVVERRNQTVVGMARSMMMAKLSTRRCTSSTDRLRAASTARHPTRPGMASAQR
jgi:transposase InsO family protein